MYVGYWEGNNRNSRSHIKSLTFKSSFLKEFLYICFFYLEAVLLTSQICYLKAKVPQDLLRIRYLHHLSITFSPGALSSSLPGHLFQFSEPPRTLCLHQTAQIPDKKQKSLFSTVLRTNISKSIFVILPRNTNYICSLFHLPWTPSDFKGTRTSTHKVIRVSYLAQNTATPNTPLAIPPAKLLPGPASQ